MFYCDISFRHAALRTITRQRQGNFKGLQEHDKDCEQQLNLLSKSFCGSRSVFGGKMYYVKFVLFEKRLVLVTAL